MEYFGLWIDNKLNELNSEGKPVYTLGTLLQEHIKYRSVKRLSAQQADALMGVFGAGHVVSVDELLNDPGYLEQVRTGKVKPPPGWAEMEIGDGRERERI